MACILREHRSLENPDLERLDLHIVHGDWLRVVMLLVAPPPLSLRPQQFHPGADRRAGATAEGAEHWHERLSRHRRERHALAEPSAALAAPGLVPGLTLPLLETALVLDWVPRLKQGPCELVPPLAERLSFVLVLDCKFQAVELCGL